MGQCCYQPNRHLLRRISANEHVQQPSPILRDVAFYSVQQPRVLLSRGGGISLHPHHFGRLHVQQSYSKLSASPKTDMSQGMHKTLRYQVVCFADPHDTGDTRPPPMHTQASAVLILALGVSEGGEQFDLNRTIRHINVRH